MIGFRPWFDNAQKKIINKEKLSSTQSNQNSLPNDSAFIQQCPYNSGEPLTVRFSKSQTSVSQYADAYGDVGQAIEPTGDYLNLYTAQDREGNVAGFDYGMITFNNPLLLEFNNTTSTGWKKSLSELFENKTGSALNKAVKDAGFDGILTVELYKNRYYFNESVNLSATKTPDPSPTITTSSKIKRQ